MNTLKALNEVRESFKANAMSLVEDSLNPDVIEKTMAGVTDLVEIVATARDIGIITKERDLEITNDLVHRLNTCIDTLTGLPKCRAAQPQLTSTSSNVKDKQLEEPQEVPAKPTKAKVKAAKGVPVEPPIEVMTVKERLRLETRTDSTTYNNLMDTCFGVESVLNGRYRRISKGESLNIGWRSAPVPKERYSALVVANALQERGTDTPITTYANTLQALKRRTVLWRVLANNNIRVVVTSTAAFIGDVLRTDGLHVEMKPLWVTTTGQVVLSSETIRVKPSKSIEEFEL